MSTLDEYNPLNAIWIPGGQQIPKPKGIILIVGPNASGKTLFLRDIENYLLTGQSNYVVCDGIEPQKPTDFKKFAHDLIEKQYLQRFQGQPDNYIAHVALLTREGPGGRTIKRNPFSLSALEKTYRGFNVARNANNPDWFQPIGITLFAQLSLDQRLALCDKTKGFEYEKEAPVHPVQGLYLRSDAQEKLADETSKVFRNVAWLDISGNAFLQLRASGGPTLPPIGEINNPLRARHYRPIEEEGDGYRSYVGICLSLLLENRPVALIDEPEMSLHPPQAYHIGRFIGKHSREHHVTFVATHNSQVFRGILDTAKKVTVVRLTRTGRRFKGLIVQQEQLEIVRHPRMRAEPILDGIFSKGVVLVESEGDREVYRAAAEAIPDYAAREIHFASVWGNAYAEPMEFFHLLTIPAAIITDLDMVCETGTVNKFAQVLHPSSSSTINEAMTKLREVAQAIKSLPPTMEASDAQKRLKELSERHWDFTNDEDKALVNQLVDLLSDLKRLRRLKEGGINAYKDYPEIQKGLQDVVEQFARFGFFFVPVGALEEWVPSLMEGSVSKRRNKLERAAMMAERIRGAEDKTGDVWAFVQQVLDYLLAPGTTEPGHREETP